MKYAAEEKYIYFCCSICPCYYDSLFPLSHRRT